MTDEKPREVCLHLRMALLILMAAFLLIAGSCASTLKKAEKAFTPSVESEKEMGREFAVKAGDQMPLVENPEIVEYVTRIGEPIVKAAQPTTYKFRFHVVNHASLNAFAVPGGYIYLFSGLLLKTRDVQEVAGVMAHELAHVKRRHSAEMMGKGTLVNLASLAAMILASAAGAPGPAATGALGAGQALQFSFSREFEREADRYGIFYLYDAGYDPNGLLAFFSTMIREQRFSTDRIPPYLLTHPVSEERMNNVENQIRVNRMVVKNPRQVPYFYRFQGLLQAEVTESTQLIPWFKGRLKENPDDARLWHQLGLAYVKYGWIEEAIAALQTALELDPQLCPAWVDLGNLQVRLGKWSEAEAMFDRAVKLRPDYPETYVALGEMFLKLNEPRHAIVFLEKALSVEESLIRVHRLLALTRQELRDEGGFHEEMATYYEKMDRAPDAIQHLDRALQIYGDGSTEGQRVKKRIDHIKSS